MSHISDEQIDGAASKVWEDFEDDIDRRREFAREILALSASASAPTVQADPPFGRKRAVALALYTPPFKFSSGYIFDSNQRMVSDDDGVPEHVAQRVLGWGRIGYMPDAAELQDEVGTVIAEALNQFWKTALQIENP